VCFIAHQCLRLHDVLIDLLLLAVQSALNACQRAQKERDAAARLPQRQSVQALVEGVGQGVLSPLAEIDARAFCEQLCDTEKVHHMQAGLSQGQEQRRPVAADLEQANQPSQDGIEDADDDEVLASKSITLQNRVADIVKALEVQGDDHVALLTAIQYYHHKSGVISQTAPGGFLSDAEHDGLVDAAGKFGVSLDNARLFIKLAAAIKAGTVNLKHSYNYRSLDDYLISQAAWDADRDRYLQRATLVDVAHCQRTVDTFAQRLDPQSHQRNQHSVQGANPPFHRHQDGSFHLSTPPMQMADSEPRRHLLPSHRDISLVDVLATVNHLTGFLDAFEPWDTQYARSKPPEKTFLAGRVGYGCFIGIGKIARISKWIDETELETTVNGYFTLENLQAANDLVLTCMDRLELPEVYRRQAGMLHTSSDGQKYGVAVESLTAHYSCKYLGKELGVSPDTFRDERHVLWHHDVISAADREAAYVSDGLRQNDVIKRDMPSTQAA
jgi:hypothetical protein